MDFLKWATLQGPHLRVFQDLKQPRTGLNHSNNVSSFFLILGPILGNECSHLQFRTSLSLESGNFAGTFQYYVIWKDSVDSGQFRLIPSGSAWFQMVLFNFQLVFRSWTDHFVCFRAILSFRRFGFILDDFGLPLRMSFYLGFRLMQQARRILSYFGR